MPDESKKTEVAQAIDKLRPLPNLEAATRQLLAQSHQEYGQLCIQHEQISSRKKAVLEHIAALTTALELAQKRATAEAKAPNASS
jgi:hypothetical protein